MRFRVIALDAKDFADWLANQKKNARTISAPTEAQAEKPRAAAAPGTARLLAAALLTR